MAKASVTGVTMVLSPEEVLWLRGYLQDASVPATEANEHWEPSDEDPTDRKMREAVFNALAEVQW